jgi:hypothetical protein
MSATPRERAGARRGEGPTMSTAQITIAVIAILIVAAIAWRELR